VSKSKEKQPPAPKSDTRRVSPEVAEYFRAKGKGWQGRIDSVLKDYVAHHK